MSNKQYLQRLGQSWYLRVKVPSSLQTKVGNTHIRRALHTRDLDEANRRKWPALAAVRAHLEAMRGDATLAALPAFTASATVAVQDGDVRASARLDTLVEKWISTSSLKTVQFQRRQAYNELRTYLGRDMEPAQVTGGVAAAYVDTRLLTSADSTSTKRRKLSALGAFWEWMASRRYVSRGSNPWRGFRLKEANSPGKPVKRPYTDSELRKLFSGSPTYPALREVMALGLFTGARIDEICSLRQGDIRLEPEAAYIAIRQSKTRAGVRTLAVAHPVPLDVIKQRCNTTMPATSQLFPELKGGGYDKKLSWHVGQAFRYHRNGRGLDGTTDFHSLRRTFVTRLENLGVDQVHIARYVGHSLPTLAFKLYSGGATEHTQRATAAAVAFPPEVEAAVRAFLLGR